MMNLGRHNSNRQLAEGALQMPVSGGRIGRRGERPYFNHPYKIRQDGRYSAFKKRKTLKLARIGENQQS
jgi:hypothetical protein